MQDIFKSIDENKKDIDNIIKEYKSINKEINKLFDTHTLPLPEEYITSKDKIDLRNYK